ncbi:transcriptional regulator [bacterium]|nr:MAG: transcriptional regulator [bacterium]
MQNKSTKKATRIFSHQNNFLSTADAIRLGIQPRTLYQMRDAGLLVQESRGLYRLADAPMWSNPDLVLVALRIPKGVICLISSLNFHGLTTQIPRWVDVAIPKHSEKPRLQYPPTRYIWLSPKSFSEGVEQHNLDGGVQIHVYSIAKTIADCFKFRNRIGMDVALEALRESLRSKRCSVSEILSYARINRVETVMRPYMEALA